MAMIVKLQTNKQQKQQKIKQTIESSLSRPSKQENKHCTNGVLIK